MRGNHDGSVDTVRYFHCLRGGSGSLVRAQKIIPGVEFAVEFVSCYDCELLTCSERYYLSGTERVHTLNAHGSLQLAGNEDDYKHIRVVHPRTIETMTQVCHIQNFLSC